MYNCFEWLQDVSQLNEWCLPDPEAFFSTVKWGNTLGNEPIEIAQTYGLHLYFPFPVPI